MTDSEILSIVIEIKNGNELGFEKLINYFKPYIYKVSNSIYIKGADINDIIQHGYIGLWRGIKYFDKDKVSKIDAFFKMCIKREIYTAITLGDRKKYSFLNNSVSLDCGQYDSNDDSKLIDVIIGVDYSAEDEVISKFEEYNLQRCILSEINKSSQLERKCMSLYMKEFKQSEICKCLNLSAKQVDNAITRVKSNFRKKYRTIEDFKIAKKFY